MMGLAPYGKPSYADRILETLVQLDEDGSFRLNMRYFDFATGLSMTNARFHSFFGRSPRAPENAIEAFLPVNDDLRRTLEALEQANADKSFVDGVRLVADKFQDVLDRYNVERIDEEGVPFDVDLHDAMLRQPANDDSIESGTVLQVLESGYRIGDKTLRHAKVIVSE